MTSNWLHLSLVILRRSATALLTLMLVSALLFVMIDILPGDVATRILGKEAPAETVAVLREKLGLNQSAIARYVAWFGSFLRGDLGQSASAAAPIADIVVPRLLNTLFLGSMALCLYFPLTVTIAYWQAVKRDTFVDHFISFFTLLLVGTPEFILATLLLLMLVVWVPLFPATSMVVSGTTLLEFIRLAALPILTLTIAMTVPAVRMLRDNLIEVLSSDYIRMAELKGLPRRYMLIHHALPNALIPTLNVTALNLGFLIGGVVVVEKVFSFPGFGSLLIDSLQLRDVPLIEATVLIAAAIYIAANLLADIGAILLNPKLRTG